MDWSIECFSTWSLKVSLSASMYEPPSPIYTSSFDLDALGATQASASCQGYFNRQTREAGVKLRTSWLAALRPEPQPLCFTTAWWVVCKCLLTKGTNFTLQLPTVTSNHSLLTEALDRQETNWQIRQIICVKQSILEQSGFMPYHSAATILPIHTLILVTSAAHRCHHYENNTRNVKITPGMLSGQENKRRPLKGNISQNKINRAASVLLRTTLLAGQELSHNILGYIINARVVINQAQRKRVTAQKQNKAKQRNKRKQLINIYTSQCKRELQEHWQVHRGLCVEQMEAGDGGMAHVSLQYLWWSLSQLKFRLNPSLNHLLQSVLRIFCTTDLCLSNHHNTESFSPDWETSQVPISYVRKHIL